MGVCALIAEQLRAQHATGGLGRFRYLASDLDGTLLDPYGAVSETTLTALDRAKQAGMRTAIATARPMRLVTPLLSDELRATLDAVIVTNGAAIHDATSGEIVREYALTAAQAHTAMTAVRTVWPTAVFGWETGDEFWSEEAFLLATQSGGILRDPAADRLAAAPAAGVHQLVFTVPGVAPAACVPQASAILGEDISVTESHGGVVELAAPDMTKGAAVAHWIAARNAEHSLRDAITFGDGHNDLTMLLSAGAGVAMGNAATEIQQLARFVTLDNRGDGVAAFVHAYLDLGQEPVAQ